MPSVPDAGQAPLPDASDPVQPPPPPTPNVGTMDMTFEDVSASSGLHFEVTPPEGWGSLPDRLAGGVCVIDVDGRSPLDVFFALRPSASGGSRLFVGEDALRYADETAARGLSDVGDALGCLAFDAEGDGDDDLLVVGQGPLRFFRNAGGGFDDATHELHLPVDERDLFTSAAAADLDADGDLDLVVAGLVRWDPDRTGDDCFSVNCSAEVQLQDPIANPVLLQDEQGHFHPAPSGFMPEMELAEPTLVVTVSDLDQEPGVDVYVGNDVGTTYRDRVLAWNGDAYLDVSDRVGMAYNRVGYGIDTMGFSHGDINRDGRMDHVATGFAGDATAVFLCEEEFCQDQARRVGTDALAPSFRWGAALTDLNNDGWVDLVEATGHIYDDEELSSRQIPRERDQTPNIMLNGGGALFEYDASGRNPAAKLGSWRGIARVDLDDDGGMDLIFGPNLGSPLVLRNATSDMDGYLRIILEGPPGNSRAVGARVIVHTSEGLLLRDQSAGEGFAGNFDPRIHVGLGQASVDRVEVRWPDGTVKMFQELERGGELILRY
ncbi:MAG: ASPIC/UnbV domain-containing protein [Myxococcota bacterium]